MDGFILAAIAAMVLWGFGDFFLAKAVKRVGDFLPLVFIGFIGAVLFAPKAFPLFSYLTTLDVIILVILGILHFCMDYCLFEGYKRGKLSVIEIIFQLEIPFTITLAVVALGERVAASTLVLISFVIIGSLLLSRIYRLRRHHLEKGSSWAVYAAFFSAAINATTAYAASEISPLLAIWFPWAVIFIIALMFLWREFDIVYGKVKKSLILLLTVSVFQIGAWLSYSYALADHELTIVIGIVTGYCAIAAFLGYWINNEKLDFWQTIGAVICIVSCISLALLA